MTDKQGKQERRLTDVFGTNNMGELDTLLVSELYSAVVSNGDAINFHDHIVLLEHFMSRSQGVNLIDKTA